MMTLAPILVALALGQSDPYVRSRVKAGDATTQCLFWTADRIVWNQDAAGNPGTPGDTEFEAIRRSFRSWQDIFEDCGNLTLQEGPLINERKTGYVRNQENHNVVLYRTSDCHATVSADDKCWDDDTCGNQYDCWDDDEGTIAITLTTYDKRSGIIYDSDITFNAARYTFTTVDSPGCFPPVTTNCVSTDVQNAATHEVGHFFGLDHTRAAGSVMFPSASVGETSKRTIDAGSRGFVCSAYAKGGPSQACMHPAISEDLGPKAGCTATGAGAGASLPLLSAWVVARVLRRRREATS
ncbi:matrixin family metalloprotease [Myxococcus sp. K15C18031901]|uniref:myxosortase-dependent metalloprotease, MXAN_2677/MXAN_2678 family n=1 Tax=Myxococcus dinghuensis TaxID=2906761 RepID=UPI0020A7E9FE|nr:myxosortase-dependent metalloprotease, MXAN_2677/MXAN_2678 family [Myxococcus dinghuensis]MCP3105431.1 matrixin family metalloprotease [Myxococcus dinghuensis]